MITSKVFKMGPARRYTRGHSRYTLSYMIAGTPTVIAGTLTIPALL